MQFITLVSMKTSLCLLFGFLVFSIVDVQGSTSSTNNNALVKENSPSYGNSYVASVNGKPQIPGVSSEGSGRSLLLKSFLLAPLGLTLFAIIAIALLPIPAITIPAGRSYISNFYQGSSRLGKVAKDVLTSDSCVERVSCEISRTIKHFGVSSDFHKLVSKVLPISSQWKERMSRGFENHDSGCSAFFCSPQASLKRLGKT